MTDHKALIEWLRASPERSYTAQVMSDGSLRVPKLWEAADALEAAMAENERLKEALRRVQDEANTVCGDWRETASLIDSICIAALGNHNG